ncbi:Uncharacterised protein [Klebsiella pneumoniae]|uniref:Uncharacterized protein n=1 Tax=Klebsiella pneumoniae TaxID=573 RepID=A0A377XMA0_KLEPN|nr:Uncharacterised protein [Klebsiella pneumoniae]
MRMDSAVTSPTLIHAPAIYPSKTLPDTEREAFRMKGISSFFIRSRQRLKTRIAQNFNPKLFAKVLAHAGMLEASQGQI